MAQKKKILYVLSKFPTFSETFVAREIRALQQEYGQKIEILSLKNPDQKQGIHEEFSDLQKDCHYLSFFPVFRLFQTLLFFKKKLGGKKLYSVIRGILGNTRGFNEWLKTLSIMPKTAVMAREVIEGEYSHIHAHFINIPGSAAAFMSQLSGIPFSITAHAWDIFSAASMESLRYKLRLAKKVFVPTQYNKNFLSYIYPYAENNIIVMRCGLDIGEYKYKKNRPLKDGVLKIITVGRLAPKKGIIHLLRACNELKGEIDFKCNVIGNGPLYREFEEYIKCHNLEDCVHLLGVKSQKEVRSYLEQSHVFILPCVITENGDRDGLPVAYFEAMAQGLITVGSSIVGIPELIVDRKTGFLVNPFNEKEIAGVLEKIREQYDSLGKIRDNARKKVEKEFDVKNTTQLMLEKIQD